MTNRPFFMMVTTLVLLLLGGGRLASGQQQPYHESERMERRLQMNQNLYPPGWPYLSHCLDPTGPNGLFNFDLGSCASGEASDFDINSKIAIVGGGPAGISMAKLLDDRGFKKVTLFETENRLGGKSKHIVLPDGEKHDVGTVWVTNKYECLELLADSVGMLETPTNPDGMTPRLISDENAFLFDMSPPSFGSVDPWSADYAFQTYGVPPQDYADTLVSNANDYIGYWTQTMGSFEYMFPDKATVDFDALSQSFLSWLEERGLFALISRLIFSTSAQGYGNLESIPALYGLMWNHPNFFGGSGTQAGIKEDWQTFWEKLIYTTDVTVNLGTSISSITRDSKRVEIIYTALNENKKKKKFDFLIMAAPMPGALDMLESPTDEELELFSEYNYKNVRYDVGYFDEAGPLPEEFNLFTWAGRADQQTDYHVTKRGEAKGTLDRYTFEEDGIDGPLTLARFGRIKNTGSDITTVFSISPFGTSSAEVQALLQADLDSYSMSLNLVHEEVWPDYFPWKNLTQVVDEEMPWRIWDNQGNSKTWYIGSYASFESVADVLDYNLKLVNERLCSEEQV